MKKLFGILVVISFFSIVFAQTTGNTGNQNTGSTNTGIITTGNNNTGYINTGLIKTGVIDFASQRAAIHVQKEQIKSQMNLIYKKISKTKDKVLKSKLKSQVKSLSKQIIALNKKYLATFKAEVAAKLQNKKLKEAEVKAHKLAEEAINGVTDISKIIENELKKIESGSGK